MPVLAPDLPQTEIAVIEMTNVFRAENKLAPVVPNAALKVTAQAYADYLARSGAFSHTADGRQPSDRARAAGYRYCMVAENLALNQSSAGFAALDLATRMVEGWKGSPPHRASMLAPHVTEIGVGIAKARDTDPKFLTVQVFGRPETLKYEVHIENRSGAGTAYVFGEAQHSIADQTHVRHTACVPLEILFDFGRITTKFAASDGGAFVITRGADGRPRVERQSAAVVVPAKSLKSQKAAR
jgi:Cysteine-rich secretory protein family